VHADFFQGRVRFGADEDRVVFARELLDAAPAGAHRALWGYLCAQAEALCEAAAPLTAAGAVAARLEGALRDGRGEVPALGAVARALGSSERTLRRRLVEEGTSWRALLDEARKRRAQELMAAPRASVIDAALALGFSDGTAFTHACRRWFACPPRALRGRPPARS